MLPQITLLLLVVAVSAKEHCFKVPKLGKAVCAHVAWDTDALSAAVNVSWDGRPLFDHVVTAHDDWCVDMPLRVGAVCARIKKDLCVEIQVTAAGGWVTLVKKDIACLSSAKAAPIQHNELL